MCIRDRDMTFATDNFQAGLLIGQWAAATPVSYTHLDVYKRQGKFHRRGVAESVLAARI